MYLLRTRWGTTVLGLWQSLNCTLLRTWSSAVLSVLSDPLPAPFLPHIVGKADTFWPSSKPKYHSTQWLQRIASDAPTTFWLFALMLLEA